ncbi:hypothetical protein EJ05DRAFT_475469 [Pseudovirgaria hyperparasitica]|uniref:Uncharacterized protein n=1 Tax=Pseudovirgaria hyperparasitica TaxID=470096 RepID=A0A6A6WBN1_9PEZI|nr:uncharacterized protein EJ05DRAFT_475469 [Pseudovirgaria hyperparasitica]KAF2759246.1 hypothetical protein EJ05DRAFT_475469 [Pseudovirgaria hyperparasitica]
MDDLWPIFAIPILDISLWQIMQGFVLVNVISKTAKESDTRDDCAQSTITSHPDTRIMGKGQDSPAGAWVLCTPAALSGIMQITNGYAVITRVKPSLVYGSMH